MSYGLEIWSSSGVSRVYDTSWIPRFNRQVTLSVTSGQTRTHSIPGLNPSTWAVLVIRGTSANLEEVTLLSDAIRLKGRSLNNTTTLSVTFILLEA